MHLSPLWTPLRRDRRSRLVIFWNSQDRHRSRVGNEQTHPLTLEHRRASGISSTSWDCGLEAVVSQANRKQLRRTVHPDLNRLATAGHLWCADVAPRVSIDCYRAIAAAGYRVGGAGP